jgi:thioredoxin 1
MAKEITQSNFEDFISEGIKVVDVYAPWCGPCKLISPIIDRLSDDYQVSGVEFGKLNADDHLEVVTNLGVRNIPTILIYKNGEVVERSVGAVTEAKLKDLIDNQLMLS